MAVGVAATAAVVAIASRAPLSGGAPVDARSAQGPTSALFMVLVGTGIAMLGALALVVWPGRRRKDDPPEREPTRFEVPWIVKVLAIVLPFAVGAALVAAAATGSKSVHTGPGFGGEPFGGASFGSTAAGAAKTTGTRGGFTVPAWLPWTLLALVAIAFAVGGLMLWLRRQRTVSEPEEASAARAAVGAAIGALDAETDPRRAVIAAYGAMQRELGERGLVRSPAEAPREYLLRALAASRATERETTTLTGLFEEARYSTHPIPERFREAALCALRSLQRRLQAEPAQ